MNKEIKMAQSMTSAELYGYAKQLGVSHELLKETAKLGRLPVVNFAAGGLGNTHQCTRKILTCRITIYYKNYYLVYRTDLVGFEIF